VTTSRSKRWQPPQTAVTDKSSRKSWDDLADRVQRGQVAIGGSYAFPAALDPPDNTLEADGSVVLIATYPELFAVYGVTFGGDGITTFALATIAGFVTRVR
jgi:hypothetical protein